MGKVMTSSKVEVSVREKRYWNWVSDQTCMNTAILEASPQAAKPWTVLNIISQMKSTSGTPTGTSRQLSHSHQGMKKNVIRSILRRQGKQYLTTNVTFWNTFWIRGPSFFSGLGSTKSEGDLEQEMMDRLNNLLKLARVYGNDEASVEQHHQ